VNECFYNFVEKERWLAEG